MSLDIFIARVTEHLFYAVGMYRAKLSLAFRTLWSICLYNVAIEPFCTWLEMRDRAPQGHLLLIRFSTVASKSQVGGWGGELGVGRVGC